MKVKIRAVENNSMIRMDNQIMIFQEIPNQVQGITNNYPRRQIKKYLKDQEIIHKNNSNLINCQLIHYNKAQKVSMMILLNNS